MTLIDSHSIVPQPPRLSKRNKRQSTICDDDAHSTPGKRFTVRDGFHLHDRNQELKESVDRLLFPPPETRPGPEPSGTLKESVRGPRVQQLSGSHEIQSNIPVEQLQQQANTNNANDRASRIASILEKISMVQDTKEREPKRPTSGRSESVATPVDSNNFSAAVIDTAQVDESSEWLIYRHRPYGASQWHQLKMEKLLHDTLQYDERQQSKTSSNENATIMCPPRPRHQSTLGSTYAERVAASRRIHHPNSIQVQQQTQITETERYLAYSREASNKDVDRLLLSLFPSPNAQATEAHPTHSSTPFSTRRSELREQTATALKSRKLRSRVDELRSLPELISKIETIQRLKQQQLIEEHGEDLVQKNRKLARLSVVHRPGEAAILPSAIDQKLQLASKRKKELDDAQDSAVRNAVSRWQKRRIQHQELQRKRYCETQWLLIVMLAESNTKWLRTYHLFKKKRDSLNKVLMARRIQHCWRQQSLVRQNSLAVLSFTPMTPLTSPFYRMPLVMKAIQLVQRFIRRWLESRRFLERRYAVAIIVTSWFEFQDVKFRRLILRFRKRVRDFQVMWREWRSITEARIKLLLLVWTRLEKKVKRRHGLMSPNADGGTLQILPMTPRPPSQTEARTVTLVEYFRAASRGESSHGPKVPKEQKRLEGVHRHLRNGGTVQAPIASVASAGIGGSPMLSLAPANALNTSQPASPPKQDAPTAPKVVKRNMKLVQNMGEEFQLAMYDYYTATKPPKSGRKSPKSRKKPVRSPRQSPTKQDGSVSSPNRGISVNSPTQIESKPPALALLNGPQKNEKVSIQLKIHLLRQLLSEKRRLFRELREKKRYEMHSNSEQNAN